MLRTVKPRNARSKRALENKAPKITENTKKALFVPGANSNKLLHDAMVDLESLKKPDAKRFQRKNEIRPFEDPASLEFFSDKNDCSLLVLSTHNKKRPNNLTFARTFNHQIYDMIELRIRNCKLIREFRRQTFNVGMKPMFVFQGALFDEHPTYQHIKSLFLDFFRGDVVDVLDPASLQHVICVTAKAPESGDLTVLPDVHFRVYLLKTEKSSTPKVPRVELNEIGPRFDFVVGREQRADPDIEKAAHKQAKKEEKTKKNIVTDDMGDQIGRIHMSKQDLSQLQTRKMKGLKRSFDQDLEDEEGEDSSNMSDESLDELDEVSGDDSETGGDFGGWSE